jgi:hypothetical protein
MRGFFVLPTATLAGSGAGAFVGLFLLATAAAVVVVVTGVAAAVGVAAGGRPLPRLGVSVVGTGVAGALEAASVLLAAFVLGVVALVDDDVAVDVSEAALAVFFAVLTLGVCLRVDDAEVGVAFFFSLGVAGDEGTGLRAVTAEPGLCPKELFFAGSLKKLDDLVDHTTRDCMYQKCTKNCNK